MSIFASKDLGYKNVGYSSLVGVGVSLEAILKTFTHYSSYRR